MSKAILVMDMPSSCVKCPMLNGRDECILQDEDKNFNADTWEDLKSNCPLKKVPQKKRDTSIINYKRYVQGWNDCIDRILEGSEEDG